MATGRQRWAHDMMDSKAHFTYEPRPGRWHLALPLAATVLGIVAAPAGARAQYIEQYFPTTVPGYQTEQGVTVLSRERPLYEEPGVHLGDFLILPRWDEAFGYNSNVTGLQGGPSSTLLRTSASLSASSLWARDALGASVSVDDNRYLDTPRQSFTNWTASIGGGYTIGRDSLSIGYSHLSLNEIAGQVGSVPSSTPIHYTVDDLRSQYTFDLGRITLSPIVDAQYSDFSSATILGVPVSQTYRNRVLFTGGVTTRYALSDQRGLLLVVEGLESHFTEPQAGQPTYNSKSALVLGGLDYQATGPWRYRLLFGVESRFFASKSFRNITAPIVAGEAIWTPTGLTTVTGIVARAIEDPSAADTAGYTYTSVRLVVDHELKRNVLLQGRVTYQLADYIQGGSSQSSVSTGGSVSWLMNRNVRLSLDYDFTDQIGGHPSTTSGVPNLTSLSTGAYTNSIALLALHLAL